MARKGAERGKPPATLGVRSHVGVVWFAWGKESKEVGESISGHKTSIVCPHLDLIFMFEKGVV